ncbi:MAG: hypothetical protein K9J13_14580 [Saprospiraceae bacterium]|nr:hypothetical protein [Saprospiraceae bacterium]
MKTPLKLFLLITVIFAFIACSSDHKSKKPIKQKEKKETKVQESFETGIVLKDIKCRQNPTYSFALYLPKSYSIANKFPVIYIFDSHAKGKYPVELYKDLAEKYGYILIGSNNSENGLAPEISNNITTTLINECNSRFSIDIKQVFTMGFSGGARVASSIAINKGGIAGVIACGAGLAGDKTINNTNFHFMGMVGKQDFNYMEILNLENQLINMQIKNNICVFDGKHEWPTDETMEEAFKWLEINSMKSGLKSPDNLLVENVKQNFDSKIKKAEDKKHFLEQFEYNKKAINFLDGLTDVISYKSKIIAIETSKEYINERQKQLENFSLEAGLQNKYAQAFQTQNISWWKREINSMNQQIKSNKNPEQSLIFKRVINYLSLIAYMYSDKTVKTNDFANADKFLQIYELVDPTNSEVYYLKATVNIKQGNKQKAIENLKLAIKIGFEDLKRLNADLEFESIRQTVEFKEMIEKLSSD